MDPSRNPQYEHCSAYITGLAHDGFFIKIYAQIPSDSVISGRELMSRIEQISGHLRRVKSCEGISRDQLAFARIDDNFHRVQALTDSSDGRVRVKFIDYGHDDWLHLSDIIVVESSLADILTTYRPLAEEFYLDGVTLARPMSNEESVLLREKIVYQTLACRLRRLHPELSVIEIATVCPSGESRSLSNTIIESGYGKKCSTEDIAKCVRTKLTTRVEEVVMQSNRQYGGMPAQFTVPPPVMSMQPQQTFTPVQMIQQAKTSANSRLMRYNKTDAALLVGNTAAMPNMYGPPSSASPPPLADRKQYAVTDGRASCMLAQPLQVKSTHAVYVSHVEDGPYSFCLQLKTAVEELLPKLRNILARHQIAAPINAQLIPGSVVMAKGSDDVLRRAVIMKLQPDTCNVYYIDFGNNEARPYSDIFQLPITAAELSPAMAMQFCLADIDSIKITDANKEYFTRLLLGKQVLIRVTESPRPAFQYCEIFWEGRSMREILVNLNSPTQYRNHATPSGDDTVVSVVFVEGPEQFYVQYISELDNINKIQEIVEAYCREQPCLTDMSSIKIGSPVAAIFPDDSRWYRGLVVGIKGDKIHVFYVDYGNSKEVSINQLCLLSPDLVTKWPSQAVTCCLIGFDAVPSSPSFVVDKMEETVLGHTFKLKLHSILSGLRLTVDLIDNHENSMADKMKALYNETHKSTSTETQSTQPAVPVERKKQPTNTAHQDDDRSSQHSSDSGGGKKNKFQRPPLKADRERGNKFEQRGDRNKPEEIPRSFTQHDDRSQSNYLKKTDSRSDWKKGPKKAYMDQADQWSKTDKPATFSKTDSTDKSGENGFKNSDWRSRPYEASESKPGWGGDSSRSRSESNDKGGGWNNRYERKPFPRGADENKNGDWGSKDRKVGSYRDRENKLGDRDNSFGDRGKKSDSRYSRFGDREQKPRWNNEVGSKPNSSVAATEEDWDGEPAAGKRSSVVISEYPHQPIVAGQEYKVLFAGMDAPNDVYVHLADCDPVLDKIRYLIDADKTAPSRPISKPVLAMPVLAKFDEDGFLYRALIKSIAKAEKGQVDVLFVDYGNSSVVSLNEVFSISVELMAIPTQAIHVIITDMPSLPKADLSACQAHFMVEGLTLKPSSTTAINMVQCVQGTLVLPGGKSIAEAIKEDPLCAGAQSASAAEPAAVSPSTTKELEPTPEPTPVWVERLDLLVGQTIAGEIVEKLGTDLYSVQADGCLGLVFPAQSEDPLSSDLTPGQKVIIYVKALSRDRLSVRYYDVKGKSLSGGSCINAVCPLPVFKRKNTFVVSHKEQEFLYLQRDNSGTLLVDLLNDMFDYYNDKDTPKHIFKTGNICAAQSLLDGNWYRARIEAASETYTVQYVDYGNTEEVCFENLRILAPEFTIPELCVRVALPVKYKDVKGCFDSLGEDPLECTFIKKDTERECWIVDLSPIGSKDNLGLKWIAEGKAESISSIPANPKLREPGWDLKKGDPIPIVVTHVESPDIFWVHLSESLTDIDALQSKLQELPDCDNTELGDIFVAKYADDGSWYRAIQCGGEDVRFIDYGNTDPAQERKRLPEDLIHPVKGYALPMRLCVKPAGAEWTADAKDAFDAFIEREESDGFKKAEIISLDFETVVDLKCGNDCLSSILYSGNHAVPFDSKVEKIEVKMVEKKGSGDVGAKLVENPSLTIDENEVPKGTVSAVVSTAISVNDFYIQLESKSDAIDKLAERLLAADAFEVIEEPSVGDYLIAKFPVDSYWYRAKVVSNDPLEVLYVDYGNVSPATEFRRLPTDLAALPLLAWHCSVGTDDTTVNEKFLNFVDESSTFEVVFSGVKEGKHVVQVSVNGQNITAVEPETARVADAPLPSKADALGSVNASHEPEPPVEVPPSVPAETSAKDETKDSKKSLPLPLKLEEKYYKNCILVHSNGPYDFYVQTDDVHIQVDEVSNILFDGADFPKLSSVKKGDFVVAQFPVDDAYYRAVVLEEDPLVVHFSDYGNTCPVTSLHKMPATLTEYPELAVRCSLQSPPGGWSADAIDKFTALIATVKKYVDLKIISLGDPNVVDIEINDLSVTEQLSSDAKSDSVQDCTGTMKAPSPAAESADKPASPSKTVQNEEFTATISFATSPSEFYFQKEEDKVSDLATKLVAAEEFKPLEKCEVGKLICAKYSEDELWYRAKVISTDPVNVLFIDYGNVSEVHETRELPDDLSVMPPLAVKASLRPQEQAWTDEETDRFLDVVYSGEMRCSILEENAETAIVRLYYQNSDMIAYLGRSCSERTSTFEYGTPPGNLSIDNLSSSSTDLLTSLAEALKINRELQETLDARLACEDLLVPTSVSPGKEQATCVGSLSDRHSVPSSLEICNPPPGSSSAVSPPADSVSTVDELVDGSSRPAKDSLDQQTTAELDVSITSNIYEAANSSISSHAKESYDLQSTLSAALDVSVISVNDEAGNTSILPHAEESDNLQSTLSAELDDTVISVYNEPADSSIFSAETPEKCVPYEEKSFIDLASTRENPGVVVEPKVDGGALSGRVPPNVPTELLQPDAIVGHSEVALSESEPSAPRISSNSPSSHVELDVDDLSKTNRINELRDTGESRSFFKSVSLVEVLQEPCGIPENTDVTEIKEELVEAVENTGVPCTGKELLKDVSNQLGDVTKGDLPWLNEPGVSIPFSGLPAVNVTVMLQKDVILAESASVENETSTAEEPTEEPSNGKVNESVSCTLLVRQSCDPADAKLPTSEGDVMPEKDGSAVPVEGASVETEDAIVDDPSGGKLEPPLNTQQDKRAKLTDSKEAPETLPLASASEAVSASRVDKKITLVKPSTSTAGTPKKPVKTVAEIKAQAKSRIFGASGRSPVAKRVTTTPQRSPTTKPQNSTSSPQLTSPAKEDKFISGNL